MEPGYLLMPLSLQGRCLGAAPSQPKVRQALVLALLPDGHQRCTDGMRCGGQLKHQGLEGTRRYHHRWVGQVSLEVLEC